MKQVNEAYTEALRIKKGGGSYRESGDPGRKLFEIPVEGRDRVA